jgi:hypothetical protein
VLERIGIESHKDTGGGTGGGGGSDDSKKAHEWPLTLWLTKLLLTLFLTLVCADDAGVVQWSLGLLQSQRGSKANGGLVDRILGNQGARCRQMFGIPQTRFYMEAWPQFCMMFLYTFGEPHSFGEIGTWNPDNRLFGLSKKTGFFRVGEMWFTLNLLGMIVARLQELRKTVSTCYIFRTLLVTFSHQTTDELSGLCRGSPSTLGTCSMCSTSSCSLISLLW